MHPLRAVAIGGVKLKVPIEQASGAKMIIESISNNQLIDNDGIYDVSDALDKAILRQNEILRIKGTSKNLFLMTHPIPLSSGREGEKRSF